MRAKSSLILIAVALAVIAAPLAAQTPGKTTTDETVKVFKGKVTFRIYCSNCHGEEGRGDGNLAEMLSVPPADLTAIARKNRGVFPTELIRKLVDGRETVNGHGLKEMPVWGNAFQESLQQSWTDETDEQRAVRKIDEVVAFVESIQEKAPGGKDTPGDGR